LIITIDGPAAAGKSTVARALAARLGCEYLDTGAMYRAATWKVLSEGVALEDDCAVRRASAEADIEFRHDAGVTRVLCDGRDVTAEIRTPEVTANIYRVADLPAARAVLIERQRRHAGDRGLVTEGRDQGTEVFPEADVKFYLDASLEVRAARRMADLAKQGTDVAEREVLKQVSERDAQDRARPVGSLRRSDDMIVIDSTCLSAEEVVSKMVEFVAGAGRGDSSA
jgi:cytidylate kinase